MIKNVVFLLPAFYLLLISAPVSVSAQGKVFGVPFNQVKVKLVSESSDNALYRFSHKSFTLDMELKAKQGQVQIQMTLDGKDAGSGRVINQDGPKVDVKSVYKGTLMFWWFAFSRIDCQEALYELKPWTRESRKYFNECRKKCREAVTQPQLVVQVLAYTRTGSNSGYQNPVLMMVQNPDRVEKPFMEFLKCMCDCIL